MTRQIILDTETTGLEPDKGHRIIEIACIELYNRRRTNRHFHVYINPGRSIELGAEQVHGLTDSFLADKPLFSDIVDELIAFIEGAELVIHNAPFDIGFLNRELKLLNRGFGRIEKTFSIVDTLALARQLHPGQRNNLDALCKRYTVDNSARNLHGALIDADLLTSVYLMMTSGQDSLFQSPEKESSITTKTVMPSDMTFATQSRTKIIYANPEELAAHEAQMMELNTR